MFLLIHAWIFTNDFAKAFKQVPNVDSLLPYAIVVQWDPVSESPAFMIPFTQLFGGRSPPLNFSRIPSWCCYSLAVLGAVGMEHCVDDLLCC